nr:MAG TPA: hypothetical protein [Caudoviricetes sp.]
MRIVLYLEEMLYICSVHNQSVQKIPICLDFCISSF